MHLDEQIDTLVALHKLITNKKTGTYRNMVKTLHVCKTTVERMMDTLKIMGAEIEYDKILRTYYYTNEFQLTFKIQKK